MFIADYLYISKKSKSGRGVFSKIDIPKGTIIEISPVISLSPKDRNIINDTHLYNYVFEWGKKGTRYCVALGYISLYNHDYSSNCKYQMNYKNKTMKIITTKRIKAGEELCVNYNGDSYAKEPVWFDKKNLE